MENELDARLGRIVPPDSGAAGRARERWNAIAKPLGSLGLLEDAVVKIAALTGDPGYGIDRRVVLVLCADNGVVRRGVTQTGSEVTAAIARNLAAGDVTVCKMAAVARADVIGVDMGMNIDVGDPRLLDRRVAAGTADFTEGPAMTRRQAERALLHGIELIGRCRERGYQLIITGEAGIGNTTTASAVASVLLDRPPAEVTGRGAGLSSDGLRRKIAAIEKAIAVNQPGQGDPLGVLAALGGFDIAGMAGLFLGGAIHRLPVLVDGLISSVAALVALRLCPASGAAMLATHVSAEPAAGWVLDALGLSPMLCAGMRLGEGTGAVAALPLLDMAYAVYNRMLTYEDMAIAPYQPLT